LLVKVRPPPASVVVGVNHWHAGLAEATFEFGDVRCDHARAAHQNFRIGESPVTDHVDDHERCGALLVYMNRTVHLANRW
jgi:hypothetical protein